MQLEDFIKHCEQHQNSGRRTEYHADYDKYQRLIKSITSNPNLIGIREIKKHYLDVGIMGGNQVVSWINVVFISKNNDVYICKARIGSEAGLGTETFLQEAYDYIKSKFNILPVRIALRKPSKGKLKVRIINPLISDCVNLARI